MLAICKKAPSCYTSKYLLVPASHFRWQSYHCGTFSNPQSLLLPLGRRSHVFRYKLTESESSSSTKCQWLFCSPFPFLFRVSFSFFRAWFSFSDSSSLLLSVPSPRPNLKCLWASLERFSGTLASKDSETTAFLRLLAIETDFTTASTGPSIIGYSCIPASLMFDAMNRCPSPIGCCRENQLCSHMVACACVI